MKQIEHHEHVNAIIYQSNKEGKSCCGDSFFIKADDEELICAVADGLGSGQFANESSSLVSEIVEEYGHEDVTTLIDRCNQAMKNKRGATVAILKVNFSQQQFTYCSVGNIRFILNAPSGDYIYPLPTSGYLSGKPRKYKTYTYSYEKGSTFIMYSDGLNVPNMRMCLKHSHSVADIAKQLETYTQDKKDDLTYVLGQLT
ncbi:PP2C family serine/threonine-protein phosphatase [Bacillus altitudinis]|uniref:PP2C family serine/threonine-protein phosphatase n=1 Tax=Bacillus TaxID=1386 RepID=UPI002102490C|nr:PP2C family serine/threonine-protein phosphatase [Bacillus sp. FS02]